MKILPTYLHAKKEDQIQINLVRSNMILASKFDLNKEKSLAYSGLDNFVAKGDGAFLVIAQRVSAAFACTSGELWKNIKKR